MAFSIFIIIVLFDGCVLPRVAFCEMGGPINVINKFMLGIPFAFNRFLRFKMLVFINKVLNGVSPSKLWVCLFQVGFRMLVVFI